MPQRQYPTAVTAPSYGKPEVTQRAAAWLERQHEQFGGALLVLFPDQQAAREDPALVALGQRHQWTTQKSMARKRWPGGPLLAAWPDQQTLGELSENKRVTALCVVPHSDEEVAAWVAAVRPEQLTPGYQPGVHVNQLDPVVVKGLETLDGPGRIQNLSGSLDQRDGKRVLRTLHEGGYDLAPEALYAWALAAGWKSRGAQRLEKMGTSIKAGIRLQVSKESMAGGEERLERWRREAAGRATT